MTRTSETGHPAETRTKTAKSGHPDTRARVRTSGHVRRPAEPSAMSGCPCPSGLQSGPIQALKTLRLNYRKAGKLIEAKAIARAIDVVRSGGVQ